MVVTASGSINNAVEAMRLGAYDFIVKPASEERLVTTMRNALERTKLQRVVNQIRQGYSDDGRHGFIGSSLPMIAVFRTIDAVAKSNASVFILGESGTGKEVCANAIHNASARRNGRFVALNCAAIPKDLMESEIFGHVKGAFTGATSDREGAAVAADGGTLFLDEICEMDINLQAKLLRFLQTGTRAESRQRPHDAGRCSHCLRHEPQSAAGGAGGPVPRGPSLQALCGAGGNAAVAGPRGRRSQDRAQLS